MMTAQGYGNARDVGRFQCTTLCILASFEQSLEGIALVVTVNVTQMGQ
jgi:hypothetical protein